MPYPTTNDMYGSEAAKPAYKKRRIVPLAVTTVSKAAMASPYNKPATAAQVQRLQKQVNALRKDKEMKTFDTALSFNVDGTGEIPATGQLVLIPQGATAETRIGEKVVVKSVYIRGSVGMVPASSATSSSTAHIYLVWDKQCNGAACSVGDIFTGTGLAVAMRNITTRQRFVILKHWYVTLSPQAGVTTAYNNQQSVLEIYRKVNIPLIYNSTAGVIGELTTNNIFLVAGTDGASDDTIVVSGRCRVTFADS